MDNLSGNGRNSIRRLTEEQVQPIIDKKKNISKQLSSLYNHISARGNYTARIRTLDPNADFSSYVGVARKNNVSAKAASRSTFTLSATR